MEISYEDTDHSLGTIETFLNYGSWIPIVHFASAAGRALLAVVEGIIGISVALFQGIFDLVTFNRLVCYHFWRNISYLGHALSNGFRTFLELLPFSFLGTLIYDKGIGRVRYKYEHLGIVRHQLLKL